MILKKKNTFMSFEFTATHNRREKKEIDDFHVQVFLLHLYNNKIKIKISTDFHNRDIDVACDKKKEKKKLRATSCQGRGIKVRIVTFRFPAQENAKQSKAKHPSQFRPLRRQRI